MKKEKIEIGGILDTSNNWDFGLMPYPQKKTKIDKDLWVEFVETREKYEILYKEILNLFLKKKNYRSVKIQTKSKNFNSN